MNVNKMTNKIYGSKDGSRISELYKSLENGEKIDIFYFGVGNGEVFYGPKKEIYSEGTYLIFERAGKKMKTKARERETLSKMLKDIYGKPTRVNGLHNLIYVINTDLRLTEVNDYIFLTIR
jgi:hypothetical protein